MADEAAESQLRLPDEVEMLFLSDCWVRQEPDPSRQWSEGAFLVHDHIVYAALV